MEPQGKAHECVTVGDFRIVLVNPLLFLSCLSLSHACVRVLSLSLSLSLAVRLDISLLSFLGFSIFATPQMSAENLPTYPRYLMHLLVQE